MVLSYMFGDLDMLLLYCGIDGVPEVWDMPGEGSGLWVMPLMDGMF